LALWRLQRDDAYVGLLLAQLARFNERYGTGPHAQPLPGPGVPLFDGAFREARAALLQRGMALARGATLVDFVAAPVRAPGADARPWLE